MSDVPITFNAPAAFSFGATPNAPAFSFSATLNAPAAPPAAPPGDGDATVPTPISNAPTPPVAPAFSSFSLGGFGPTASSVGVSPSPSNKKPALSKEPGLSRADLRAMHEKPMKDAWMRHVTGVTKFIKEGVLIAALAGFTVYNNTYISSAVPCADSVFEAKTKAEAVVQRPFQIGNTAAGPTFGKLDIKGLLCEHGGNLKLSEPCMNDIVAALKTEFPDSKVAFVKAAPASGGKDVLTVCWE
jgi:hypothetical protein